MNLQRDLIVPGAPRQKKNSGRVAFLGKKKCPVCKRGFRLRILPAKPWERWAEEVVPILRAQQHGREPIDYPANARALFFTDTRRKVDACNLYEGLADILEAAGVVDDDARIVSWDGSRVDLDRENPRVEVTLEPL